MSMRFSFVRGLLWIVGGFILNLVYVGAESGRVCPAIFEGVTLGIAFAPYVLLYAWKVSAIVALVLFTAGGFVRVKPKFQLAAFLVVAIAVVIFAVVTAQPHSQSCDP